VVTEPTQDTPKDEPSREDLEAALAWVRDYRCTGMNVPTPV
jgi:hypothetical protein